VSIYHRPAHCSSCGKAFPWTRLAVTAAGEYAAEVKLEIDQNELADIIEHLIHDTPKTTISVSRMKRALEKAGPIVAEGFRKILVDVIAETAKKTLFPSEP
jgi:hypothetical protein